ncbi:hypothetical protein HYH03_017848 [Edaphochlamys debaryana]|uniref:RNA helicase n=1 Tax=Edaphochlamys debaryana TaxID=47281 RepID=A0A836BNQ7_9CHLO|nr:hypothetical protein HYH03_017848 [Edaphochlamys debaryana]|eukprot:KAG2483250.1 hypothetical protein HYH03_017848 [Edaphochlamys debaryana]
MARAAVATLRCEICNVEAASAEHMRAHLAGQRHATALDSASPDRVVHAVASAIGRNRDDVQTCDICGLLFTTRNTFDIHMRSNRHAIRQYFLLARAGNLHLANPRNVLISQLPEPLPALSPGQHAAHSINITNLSHEGDVTLHCVRFLQPVDGASLHDIYGVTSSSSRRSVQIPYGTSYTIELRLAPRFLGIMRGVIMFDFGPFQAVRALSGSCADPEVEAEVKAAQEAAAQAGPRQRRRQLERVNEDVVPGEAPAGADSGGRRGALERPIGAHRVTSQLRSLVERCDWKGLEALIARTGGAPGTAASVRSYAERLKLLLGLEELQHEVDVRQYDIKEEQLTQAGRRFALQVPGLAENRPSVLKGDRILVRPSDGSSGGREWEGFVHEVKREKVVLGFNASFAFGTWVKGRRFDGVLARVAAGELHPLLLLPGSPSAPLPRPLQPDLPPPTSAFGDHFAVTGPGAGQRIVWSNARLNAEQRLAVREAVRGAHHPLPYIIFGPPGTGKTSTLVEVAVQLLRADPSSCLLLVAPSNSAADQLMERLLGAGRPLSELLRVCAYTRDPEDLPPDLLRLKGSRQLNWDEGLGAFALPSKERLAERGLRAIAATCATAAMLYHAGLPPGRFSHVLVDEAGHAEEPLALAALAGLAGPNTRVIMAGDPRQLGPVILSPIAKRQGFDVSLLERLAWGEPYGRRQDPAPGQAPYRTAYITKLLDNYRSHPDILAVPNAAFYDGELLAAAAREEVTSLLHWEELPNRQVPILFHHLKGRDLQEARSPSWYNLEEINQVKRYVQSLMALRGGRRPTGADIGVISPYRKQVQCIRAVLRPIDQGIKVGSVEEFQGQERRIIIISTVRSDDSHLAFDSKHRLGFLKNPKRFNVAITRAKALLIVVGNAEVLAADPHWRQLLRFLAAKGSITGPALPYGLLEPQEDEASEAAVGSGGGAGAREDAEEADLAAQLQRLVLTTAQANGQANGNGNGAGAYGREADEQMTYHASTREYEGGEMRRME